MWKSLFSDAETTQARSTAFLNEWTKFTTFTLTFRRSANTCSIIFQNPHHHSKIVEKKVIAQDTKVAVLNAI